MPLLDGDTSFVAELSFHESLQYGATSAERTPLLLPILKDDYTTKKPRTTLLTPINEQQSPSSSIWKRFTGLFLAILATFIYSMATLILKLFSHYHPFTLSIWRFQGMIIPSIPVILIHMFCLRNENGTSNKVFGTILPLNDKKNIQAICLIIVRSLVGCTSTILQIFAVQRLNLADASVIVFSSPVFVTIFAHCLLKEKAGWFSIVTAIFTLTGVAIISRPPILTGDTSSMDLIGIGFALGSMLLSTLVYIILRFLRDVHYSVVTISYGVLGSIECICLAWFSNVFDLPHGAQEWGLAAGLIMFTFLGQTFLILALKFEQAGPVSLLQSTDVVFSFILQFIFLGTTPDICSISGALIVITGVGLITLRKWIITLPDDHPIRLRFNLCMK